MSKHLTSTAEIAKLIRADIKVAIKAGTLLPTGAQVTVRTSNYAGGSSIRIELVALPDSFQLSNLEQVEFKLDHPEVSYWDMPFGARERFSPEGQAVVDQLNAIVNAYHEDNSTDDGGDRCWNVNFYKHVDVDGKLVEACRERTAARIVADRAARAAAGKPRVYLRAIATLVEGT
jgi:hypothetical protein